MNIAPINTLVLCLLLFWGLFFILVYWAGRYLVYLYHQGNPQTERFFVLEKICCNWLGIDQNSHRLGIAWLKLTIISFAAGYLSAVLSEWLAFVDYGVQPYLAWRALPWAKLFNLTASYFTNTGWDNGYQAVIENVWGQTLVLMPLGWLNAASWISLAIIFAESLFKKGRKQLGNLYVYIVRSILYLLLPLAIILTLLMVFIGNRSPGFLPGTLGSNLQNAATVDYIAYIKQRNLISDPSLAILTDAKPPKSIGDANIPKTTENKNSCSKPKTVTSFARKAQLSRTNSRRRSLLKLLSRHFVTLDKTLHYGFSLRSSAHRWWQIIYQASDLVTANGRIAFAPYANVQTGHLSNEQQLSMVLLLWGVLLIPAALTQLISAYTGKSRSGNTILIIMILLLSCKVTAVAISEFNQMGTLKIGFTIPQSQLQQQMLLWLNASTATATSLGNSAVNFDLLTTSSKLISTASLVLGNLIWGSNGIGLVTMLFYLLFSTVWLELMVAKRTRLSSKVLKFSGIIWLMLIITIPSLIAMIFTLPHLFASPSAPISLTKLIPMFYYYLSMFQSNGAALQFSSSSCAIWLGSISMLMGHLLNGGAVVCLIGYLKDQPIRNKRLNLLLDYPIRAIALLTFTIMLNLLTVAPILMLGLA